MAVALEKEGSFLRNLFGKRFPWEKGSLWRCPLLMVVSPAEPQ